MIIYAYLCYMLLHATIMEPSCNCHVLSCLVVLESEMFSTYFSTLYFCDVLYNPFYLKTPQGVGVHHKVSW